jgi:1-acyl-sn-glycerol-3-phosphate acyltransferase
MRYPPWSMLGPAAIARWALRTYASSVRVEGLENIPAHGPVMLVARHFHHLLDGAVLARYVPRPVHIVVGLDWTADAKQRAWMERACRAAQYPIVLRPATLGERGGYARSELARYTRTGLRDASALLAAGRVVLVFPEGYPNVDPAFARKANDDTFLPFAPGYLRMIAWAQRAEGVRVAVVPVGFRYTRGPRWSIVARIGAARFDPVNDELENDVRELSYDDRGCPSTSSG